MSDKLTLSPPATSPPPAAPIADASTGPAAAPASLEAQLNQAVSQLTAAPSLSFPTPPSTPQSDFGSLEQSTGSMPPPIDPAINTADLAQTQVSGDPFGGQVSSITAQQIQEPPALPTTPSKASAPSFLKSKAIIAALAVVILGGGAFATVNIISQNGDNPIAPNVPKSQPKAAESVPTKKPTPKAVCGNGMVEAPETCDDGNIRNGDGCGSGCKKESAAPPSPSPAASLAPSPVASSSADPLEDPNLDDFGSLDDLAI